MTGERSEERPGDGEKGAEQRLRELVAAAATGEGLPPAIRAAVASSGGRLVRYLALLRAANEEMNLVSRAAAEPEELVGRHLSDALAGLPYLPPPGKGPLRLLDIGSGGGLPAIPMLLIRKDLTGTLVESTKKKARFLASLAEPLELTLVVSEARFPDSFPMTTTAPFDLLTTRAVAQAGRIVRAARPLLGKKARALLWTTRELFAEALADSGFHRGSFHETPGAQRRGIGVIECST